MPERSTPTSPPPTGALGAGFASAYIADLGSREQAQAVARLGGTPNEAEYQALVATFGFQAAVLLDGEGRVLAVDGRVGVSQVVPSAAAGVPVLAFAVPFDTPAGRRVFSGAFEVARTPLDGYLGQTVAITPHNVYLIDDTGAIAASSPTSNQGRRRLAEENPALNKALERRSSGRYESASGAAYSVIGALALSCCATPPGATTGATSRSGWRSTCGSPDARTPPWRC